jgi:hypothetical protein
VIIQKQVDGLGNFHAPPPVFDGIMLMLMLHITIFSGNPISFCHGKRAKLGAWLTSCSVMAWFSPFFVEGQGFKFTPTA